MRIALSQLNYRIADYPGNVDAIVNAINKARKDNAHLVIFSELSVCGYPPLDLLEQKDLIEEAEKSVKIIANECRDIAAIVGAP